MLIQERLSSNQETHQFCIEENAFQLYPETKYNNNQKINFRNPTDNQPKPDTNLSKLKLCCNFFCCLDSNFSRKIIVFGIHNFEAQTIFGSSHEIQYENTRNPPHHHRQ